MIDDELRAIGPKGLSVEEQADLRRDLVATMRSGSSAGPVRSSGTRRRFGRRTVALGVAALLTGTATAAAAYVGLTRPSSQQAATMLETSKAPARVHLEGWRPPLDAESAQCTGALGTPDFEVYASDGPLDSVLTEAEIVAACRAKATTLGPDTGADQPVLCRTDRTAGPSFAEPTVPLSSGDCATAGLEEYTAADLVDLNAARATEVALRAIDDPCPSRNKALVWSRRQAERTDSDLVIVDSGAAGHPPKVCFGTYVDWIAGTATVDVISITD